MTNHEETATPAGVDLGKIEEALRFYSTAWFDPEKSGGFGKKEPGKKLLADRGEKAAMALRELDRIAPQSAPGWRTIESAPYDTPVIIETFGGRVFKAFLVKNGSMNEDETECDQWRVAEDDPCPECWTDHACWASNADDTPSDQPAHWMPLPAAPSPQSKGEG